MSDQPWTIGRLLTWTTDFLRTKGAESPRLDAEVLLAHARGCQRIELYTAYEEAADDALRDTFRQLVGLRAEGKPVAYLVGYREFFSLNFLVSPDVLIPRPETEMLVVRALDLAKSMTHREVLSVADVGTGSGALAVCLAKHIEACRVTAIDRSPEALSVAQNNARQHEVEGKISFLESNLFERCSNDEEYDLIVSNPPYIKTSELSNLATDVREFEPRLALDGGEHGVDVISRLIPQAAQRLQPGGWLLIEVSPSVADSVQQLLMSEPLLQPHSVLNDTAGLPRIAQACHSEKSA